MNLLRFSYITLATIAVSSYVEAGEFTVFKLKPKTQAEVELLKNSDQHYGNAPPIYIQSLTPGKTVFVLVRNVQASIFQKFLQTHRIYGYSKGLAQAQETPGGSQTGQLKSANRLTTPFVFQDSRLAWKALENYGIGGGCIRAKGRNVNASLEIVDCDNLETDQVWNTGDWEKHPTNPGFIQLRQNLKCLSPQGADLLSGIPVVLQKCNMESRQLWTNRYGHKAGLFQIQNVLNGLCLTPQENGQFMTQEACGNIVQNGNQFWRVRPVIPVV